MTIPEIRYYFDEIGNYWQSIVMRADTDSSVSAGLDSSGKMARYLLDSTPRSVLMNLCDIR